MAGCSDSAPTDEPLGTARSAIFDGYASPAADDFSVYVEIARDTTPSRCSGTLIDSRIVVTARHCVLVEVPGTLNCTIAGEPTEGGGGAGIAVNPAAVSVSIGNDKAAFREVIHGGKIITTAAPSVCRDDLAFVVLERDVVNPVVAKLGTKSAMVSDAFRFVGWGRSSTKGELPTVRQARDNLVVTEVGPATIPPLTFAIPSRTLCYGDSGGGAYMDGALVGVFSRLDSGDCDLAASRNILIDVTAFADLAATAFDAIGKPAPWLTTTSTDAGASPVTPVTTPPPPSSPPKSEGGCTISRVTGDASLAYGIVVAGCFIVLRTRRRRRAGP